MKTKWKGLTAAIATTFGVGLVAKRIESQRREDVISYSKAVQQQTNGNKHEAISKAVKHIQRFKVIFSIFNNSHIVIY